MRSFLAGFLLLCAATSCLAKPVETVKVTIEATELDRLMLLEKLNDHGKDHNLKFLQDDQDYNYRIAFATGQGTVGTNYGEFNSSEASATVYDHTGTVLFNFKRAGRGTDKKATDSVAKEIIRRILTLRSYQSK